jgi:LPXTG-site transpeptidase (sortase) family protein
MMRIPSIGLETVFLEGVDEGVLRVGPGHLPWTALPGRGVSVIAAHRDMHFRDLEDLRPGHRVRVRTAAGSTTYRVIGARVADPEDRWVVRPGSRPLLRLVTCWPSNWLGPAPQRLVVTAAPVADPARAAPAPATPVPAIQHIALADTSGDGFDDSSLPPVGTAGATVAGLSALAALRTGRRTRWWFLAWTLGLGVAGLALLAAWAGPGIVSV